MKKVFCTLYGICALICSSQAQTFFGLTKGENSKIVKYDAASNSFTIAPSNQAIGSAWYNDLLLVGTKFYGLTAGEKDDYGSIFSFEPATSTCKQLHVFNGENGKYPHSTLIISQDGKLYGMTESGGVKDKGVIFSFDPSLLPNNAYKILYDFGTDNGMNGSHPFSGLLLKENKLYGMTESGGEGTGVNEEEGFGVIFSYDINASQNGYQKLVDFDGENGRSPYGNLIQATNGRLYGMTKFGGEHGFGVLFSFDPASPSSSFSNMDFNWSNGAWPNGSLVQASENKLFGLTEAGGANNNGVLFSFDISSSNANIETIASFNEVSIGRFPLASLAKGTNGKLYGMTESGGTNDNGTFFYFDPLSTNPSTTFSSKSFNPGAVIFSASTPTEVDIEALPVHIISFTVKNSNQGILLKWSTEEVEIERYEIERSKDGIWFSSLGFVEARNLSGRAEYSFTDMQPFAGKNYYRLKIHEQNGAPHYSTVKVIALHLPDFTVVVQPNPVSSTGILKLVTEKSLYMTLKLADQNGRIIKQWNRKTYEAGQYYIPLEMKQVVAGAYHLIVETSKGKKVIRLIKADR